MKLLISILAVFLISSCDFRENDATVDQFEKPNVIYILADDLGYGDLSIYGQRNFTTPNIDKLASEGMLFTQHYSGSTVCAPSRSALLTGMHTGHTVVRGNKEVYPEGQHPIPDETHTMAETFKKAGYATGIFGKWGLGYPGSSGDPLNQGFDVFFGYNCQRFGHNYYPRHLWSNTDSIVLEGNSGLKKEVYAPELIHEKTLKFIDDHKETPFFLYIPTVIPHAELAAPELIMQKHRGKYAPEQIYQGYDEGPDYRRGPYESQSETHAAFAAMIEILDTQVGEIIQKTEELGISDHTLIVFTSDNGPHQEGGADPDYFDSNGPLRGVKRDLYEGGIRVPMFLRWPEVIEPDSKSDHISAFWDILPTFSEIIGVESPKGIDGISFLPTLMDKTETQQNHNYLYWEFHELGGRQAIRKGNWKAVKYNVFDSANSKIELYDLKNDISEINDVASSHPKVIAEMRALLKTARTPSTIFTFEQKTYLGDQ